WHTTSASTRGRAGFTLASPARLPLEALLQPAERGIVSYQRCGAPPAADAGPLRRATGAGILQRALAQGLGEQQMATVRGRRLCPLCLPIATFFDELVEDLALEVTR
ncbi:unnamed protein product, partial [Urochloa humidicola]